MKKLINYIFVLQLVFLMSCNDGFLDKSPFDSISSSVVWSSDENAKMAVNGIYHTFSRDFWLNFYDIINNIGPTGYTQIRMERGISHYEGLSASNEGLYLDNYWRLYRVIKYSNDVIANVPDNPNITAGLGTQLVGEAKFLRGLSYFYLTQLFGDIPILDKPLPVEETYLPKNTRQEVIELVIADFKDAMTKLPVSYPSVDLGRATQGAAIAMLGKTYLYDKQWANAATELEKLFNSPYTYKLTNEFSDNFFAETENNSEKVFDLQYISMQGYGSNMDNRYGYRNHFPNYGEDFSTASNIALEIYTNKDGSSIDKSTMPKRTDFPSEETYGQALIAWYNLTYKDADPRLHKSVILPGSDFSASTGTFRLYWPSGTSSMQPPGIRTTWPELATIPIRKMVSEGNGCPLNHNCPLNWPLIRFADVLLMYAEAKNEQSGSISSVYEAVNKIRSRAGIAALPIGLSKDDMRKEIRLERFRELLFEATEYFDVLRWKTAHTNDPIFGLNHNIYDFRYITKLGQKVFNENKNYLWPIPLNEIDINPKLTQNPNW